MNSSTRRKALPGLLLVMVCLAVILLPGSQAIGQAEEITWTQPLNISNTKDYTSTDPSLVADPTGRVHLFWAEKVSDTAGSQPDTVLYSAWDGSAWSKPIDIFFSPPIGNPVVAYPQGVIDDYGRIHLVWMSEPNFPNYTLNYSSAPADQAGSAGAWKTSVPVIEDLSGTKYSVALAYEPPETLHIAYARVQLGDTPPEPRTVSYIQSKDGGNSWSDPKHLYTIPDLQHGASDVHMLVVNPAKIFVSWTEWDETGNGKAIGFTRSLDDGETWDAASRLTEKKGNEYERDWNNLVYLGESRLMAIWEGGWRAYRHAMYSDDFGETWSDPIDTFPWLIGENGTAEFATDSNGKLHLFIAQRIREGVVGRMGGEGLWHSVWEGGKQWQEPSLIGGINPMVNPKVVIVGGNQFVATWYAPPVYEIMVMVGRIESAPAISPRPWPTPSAASEKDQSSILLTSEPSITTTLEATSSMTISLDQTQTNLTNSQSNPASLVLLGVLPSVLIITVIVIVQRHKRVIAPRHPQE